LILRGEMMKRLDSPVGDCITIRSFHDRLLAEGSIPVSLIRRQLLAE